MSILKNIITWLLALFLMPIRIQRLYDWRINIEKHIVAISSLLIQKEMNPDLLKKLIPSLSLPDDVLSWDTSQRYKAERCTIILQDIAASQITSIVNGCKSLPWRLARVYGETAIDVASTLTKPGMFENAMLCALVGARDIPYVLKLGEIFETFDKATTRKARFHNVWKLYIAALLVTDNKNKALNLLDFYVKHYNLRNLENFLAVAHFAQSHNLSNERINKSARLYEQFKKNVDQLETVTAGKSVAVVASGPYELGQGKGREIDNHDLVIRFNAAHYINDQHQTDYGSRTDINVCGTFFFKTLQLQALQKRATFLFFPHCVDTSLFPSQSVDVLSHCVKNTQAIVSAMPGVFWTELVHGPIAELDIGFGLSTGARFLTYFKQIMGNSLTIDNIYGFSFKYAATDFSWRTPYHFDAHNLCDLTSSMCAVHPHNFLQESRLLRRLFGVNEDDISSQVHPTIL